MTRSAGADMGSEHQKDEHIRAALRGDEVLVQLLSEPSGGSDLAGVITRAERRGDRWIINGAKTWTNCAFAADYGLCLARTNWDVPKHEGLTMFLVPIRHPGITMNRIKQIKGTAEFCEEFFDDVDVGDDAVVGSPGQGWEVASRQLYHERRTMGDGSEYTIGAGIDGADDLTIDLVGLVEATSQAGEARVREMVGRALVHRAVDDQLSDVFRAVLAGALPPAAGSIIRAFMADTHNLETDTAYSVACTTAVVGDEGDLLAIGTRYLERQTANIGGGTTEIARNVIAERVLNLPREYAADSACRSTRCAETDSSDIPTDTRRMTRSPRMSEHPRDIRELTDDPDAYRNELLRRWTGLLSYRYIGRNHSSMNVGAPDDTVTIRRDMRNEAGGIMAAPLAISSPEGCQADLVAVPNPVIASVQIVHPGYDVKRIEIVESGNIHQGRMMGYGRCKIVDADNPDRVIAFNEGQGAIIGVPPEGLDKMDVSGSELIIEDSPDLPPLWQAFGASKRPDGHWMLPALSIELASPDAALHIGPQHVLLETAATDLAADIAGTRRIQVVSWHVMFMSRGKVGPFRVEGTAHAGTTGRVGVRMLLHDEGNADKPVTSAAAIFDVLD